MSFWQSVGYSGNHHNHHDETCSCITCRRNERKRLQDAERAAEEADRAHLENHCMFPAMGRQMGYMDGNMPEYILFAPTFRPAVIRTFAVSTASRLPPQERKIRITDGRDVLEERKARRVQEILARLNYLASKVGLDYYDFKAAIERDLEEEAVYQDELRQYEEDILEFEEAQGKGLHETVVQFGEDFEEFQSRNPDPQHPVVLICPALPEEDSFIETLTEDQPIFIPVDPGHFHEHDLCASEEQSVISELEVDESYVSDLELDPDQSISEDYYGKHGGFERGEHRKSGRLPSRGQDHYGDGFGDRLPSRGRDEYGGTGFGDRLPSRGRDEFDETVFGGRLPSRGRDEFGEINFGDRLPSRGGNDYSDNKFGDRLPSRGRVEQAGSGLGFGDRLPSRGRDEHGVAASGFGDRLPSRGRDDFSTNQISNRTTSRGREFLQDRSREEWLLEAEDKNEPEMDPESEMQSEYITSEDESYTMTEDTYSRDTTSASSMMPPSKRPLTPLQAPAHQLEALIQRPRPKTPLQQSGTPFTEFQRPSTAGRFRLDQRPGTAEASAFLANPPTIRDLDEENLKEINDYNKRALHFAQFREDFKSVEEIQKEIKIPRHRSP